MAPGKPARNAPCPCGSGRKFKHCCRDKGFDWVVDDAGQAQRAIPLSDEALAVLEQQRQQFQQRFGRPPAPDDRLFFDAPPLEQVEHRLVAAMKRAGLDPAFIHAFEQTGLLVSTDNEHLIPEAELARWHAAVAAYRAAHQAGSGPADESE
jgi:hypothetical protein